MKEQETYIYEFDKFRVDLEKRQLISNETSIALTPKVFDTLIVLIQNCGKILGKEKFLELVWPDTVVEENNLTQNISVLRKIFNESPNDNRYIATIPKRGYRFIANVTTIKNGNGHQNSSIEVTNDLEATIPSIAVLPFRVLGNKSKECLGIGITDALITRLSNLKQISIRPTSAILKYEDTDRDLLAIRRELGVSSILEGSIRLLDNRMRVTVQLVCTEDGTPWWAGKFDEEFTNIFEVEDSISQQVSNALMLKLSSEEKSILVKRYTQCTTAYQAYIRGRYFWNKRTQEGFEKAIENFEEAISNDSEYALAYSGLADCYLLLGDYNYVPPSEIFLKAENAVMKALYLDDTLAEAHASLGMLYEIHGKWGKAKKEYERSIELNPNYSSALQWYAEHLAANGLFEEALEKIHQARRIDPVSLILISTEGKILLYSKQYDEAIKHLQKALELEPNFALTHYSLGLYYQQMGMYEKSLEEFEAAAKLSTKGKIKLYQGNLGYTYAMSGRTLKALEILNELIKLSKITHIPSCSISMIYAGLGEIDQMFEWLKKALDEQSELPFWIKVDPKFDPFRSDSRFIDLLRHIESEN